MPPALSAYAWIQSLGSLRLPLLPCGSGFPVGCRSRWASRWWASGLACRGRGSTPLCPCSQSTGSGHCKDRAYPLFYLERGLSRGSLFCRIPSVCSEELSRVAARSRPTLVLLPVQDGAEGEFFFRRLQDWLTSFWIVSRLGLSSAPSLALLLPFLTSGPGLGAWPGCWVSVEFLRALIPQKVSGSTTTTKLYPN